MNTRINTVSHLLATFKEHDIADESQRQRLANLAPGAAWLTALQALAAWLAALLLTAAFTLMGGMVFGLYLFFAVVLIAAGMALFWRQQDSAFMNHLALGLSVAGQALLAFAWMDEWRNSDVLASAVLALALTVPRTSLPHRSLCLAAAAGCGVYSVLHRYADWLGPSGVLEAIGWLGVALVAGASALWLARRQWAVHPRADYLAALAHSATFAGLAIIWVLHGSANRFHFRFDDALTHYGFYKWGAVLAWLAIAGWLLRVLPKPEQTVLVVAAVALGALGVGAPAMLLCLTLTLATFHACQRVWLAVSVAGAWFFLGLFYYSLTQTLLVKSATLAAAGVVMLAFAWVIRHRLGARLGEHA